ncbi:MAG: type III-A CRISPR-associated protein Csm2 [Candidatus Marinimicrobia bacterium]|nr:type III-A CRISPR-associated protein Csm2 [Candidatus Neomarinimicrobiota bacterium]
MSFKQLDEGKQKISTWLNNRIDKDAVQFSEDFGKYLAKNRFSKSQIRNIFSELKRIQMAGWNANQESDLLLMKPKLAYAAQRQSGRRAQNAAEDLKEILGQGIDQIVDSDNPEKCFENFVDFFEAILAYHKSFER